jgi:hypothetical protein
MKTAPTLLLLVLSAAGTARAQETDDPQYLLVVQGEMPLYPPLARAARVSGSVRLQVTVKEGEVVAVRTTSGNPLLASPATANVKTWKFYKTVSATFVTTFTYQLETEESPEASNPTAIVLELPTSVKITARPTRNQCNDCGPEHNVVPKPVEHKK